MSESDRSIEKSQFKLTSVEDYESPIGANTVSRVPPKAKRLHDLHLLNINSTYYGGGVAEILSPLTLLMNSAGIKAGWRVIEGRPDFFSITKKMHNALPGADINMTDLKTQIYEGVAFEIAVRNHIDHDIVIVHDPQPQPPIWPYRKRAVERIVRLLKDRTLAMSMGRKARESVRNRFLTTRLMEDWFDLIGPFETIFKLKSAT